MYKSHVTCILQSLMHRVYHIVAISRPVYYSILNSFGQSSQYISIINSLKFLLNVLLTKTVYYSHDFTIICNCEFKKVLAPLCRSILILNRSNPSTRRSIYVIINSIRKPWRHFWPMTIDLDLLSWMETVPYLAHFR